MSDPSAGSFGGGWTRAAAWVGGVLLAAVVGGLAWLASGTPASPAAGGRGFWDLSIAPMPPPVSAVLDQPLPTLPVAASAPASPDRVEVCGFGVVSTLDWGRRVRRQVAAEEDARARQQVIEALRSDPDELTQAVALVLQSSGGLVTADEPVACEGPACPDEPERVESAAARARRIAANTAPRDRLARLALASRSPPLYGLAWQVCRAQGRHDEPSACQLLSADQWARLEPDNAAAWFEVAHQARARGDRAAVAEALFRVSHATVSDARIGRLNERLLSRLPQEVSLLNALALGTEMEGIERTWAVPTGAVLGEHCSATALRDANRHQRCDAIAGVLVRHGRTTAELLEGVRLGERLGWPVARTAALHEEVESLQQATEAARPQGTLGCAAVVGYLKHLKAVGEHGELAAARRLMDAPRAPGGSRLAEAVPVQAQSQAAAAGVPPMR